MNVAITGWNVLDYVYIAVMVVVFLGASIFVHELGHFLSARFCGMVVDTFSLGFGPALWKRKIRNTTYKIGIIPLGGYVALPQLDPEGMERLQGENGEKAGTEGESRKLPPVSPWKRLLVIISGPAGNIALAVIIAWLVYWIGIPTGVKPDKAIVGAIDPACKAYEVGLREDDVIRSLNGKPVSDWDDFVMRVALFDDVVINAVSAEGAEKTVSIKTSKGKYGIRTIQGLEGKELCVIEGVTPGGPAEQAGIKTGDIVVDVDGARVSNSVHFVEMIGQAKGKTIAITARRGKERVRIDVIPKFNAEFKRAMIGVNLMATMHPEPWGELKRQSLMIFRFLKALVTPKQAKNAAKAVGGPLAILDAYARLVGSSLMLAVWFTGILNMNLAIINLLPIPVLDGGHIVFLGWEIATRKPPSPKVVGSLVNGFAVLLIALFVLITFRDILVRIPEDSKAGRAINRIEKAVGSADENTAIPEPAPAATNDTGAGISTATTNSAGRL